ncbi:MAG: hypothetical protein CTY35_02035 [Methylotenera sp.]|uniref:ankyrin repeat domain-containing protein n=1 Tax=Methylotenera sp. TaxID=2051956 RepID=UPI000D4C058E|nr:ankyrin repeat domain-containing protein [Methylotenera sp.]PPC84404.1 MAG: hypothetical protein CTY38_02255 [Methylotenera sp.]PPD01046.1 MAG: hypothetical protein CTY35_02035 [Methylotenera sp.]
MKASQSDVNKISKLCETNQLSQVRKLIAQFPDVAKSTQLMSATIKGGASDVLKFLFACGADVAVSGNVLLSEAAISSAEVLSLCIGELKSRFESRPDVLYSKGSAMVVSAAAHAKVANVKYLLEEGFCSININHLHQPLLDACKKGNKEVVDLLIAYGAKPDNTHYNSAIEHGHLEVMSTLKEVNHDLVIDRQIEKVILSKREHAIGTPGFDKWAEIANIAISSNKRKLI